MCVIHAKERRKVEESYGNWHPATGSKKAKSIRSATPSGEALGLEERIRRCTHSWISWFETEKAQSSYALRLLVFR